MRYSIEPRERRYVKGYGFLSFPRNIGKNVSNKYGQKLVDTARKSAADALQIAGKIAIQKTIEASGDLVGNFIADNITSIQENQQVNHTQIRLAMKYQKKDIYLQKDIYIYIYIYKLLMN